MRRSPLDSWLGARTGLAPLDLADLADWQLAELRRTLAWARQASAFHAERLAGLDLSALRSLDDLARLPRMTAADLDAPSLLTLSQDAVARVVSLNTSGSSGPPKRLLFSDADLLRTLEFFRIGMSTFTRADDAVLVLLPGRTAWGVADLLARALPDIKARAVLPPEHWTPADLPPLLAAQNVAVLVAAPAQLAALLGHEDFRQAARGRLRTLLSTAEPLAPGLRAEIEAAWGCEIFDHWGMTETGYGGGVECSAHLGYHLRECDLLLEVAHPATGAPLPPGETGEVLLTTLGERALPLLRYRTGDAARWLPGPCACGSPLRRLGPVQGRFSEDGERIEHIAKGRGGT